MPTEAEIRENLLDAGCSETEMRSILKSIWGGNLGEAGKQIEACRRTQRCVIKDDAIEIAEKVKEADTLVFATPIYYYEMSGQMKTVLDRLNPIFPSDYKFRNVYMLMAAAEDEAYVCEKAVSGLQGWIDCFEKAHLAGSLFCGGINDAGEAESHGKELHEAYEFGRSLQ